MPHFCHILPRDGPILTSRVANCGLRIKFGPSKRRGAWRGAVFDLRYGASLPGEAKGRTMNETKSQASESSNHVLFPMAVGVLFLAMLVAGALLG